MSISCTLFQESFSLSLSGFSLYHISSFHSEGFTYLGGFFMNSSESSDSTVSVCWAGTFFVSIIYYSTFLGLSWAFYSSTFFGFLTKSSESSEFCELRICAFISFATEAFCGFLTKSSESSDFCVLEIWSSYLIKSAAFKLPIALVLWASALLCPNSTRFLLDLVEPFLLLIISFEVGDCLCRS